MTHAEISSPRATQTRATAIVVGASSGAVEALGTLLPALPENYPLPILIVVHLPPDKISLLSDLFRQKCRLIVHDAEDKEPMQAGTIYFAPPDYHLLVEDDRTLSLSSDEPVRFSRPSIDVLFESAADAIGPELVGIILTGANSDGAEGLRAVSAAGGVAIVQHPDSAQTSIMPRAALAACPEAAVMTLEQIATYLNDLMK